MAERKFEDKPAVRAEVPLLVGLVGPSSSGKTVSALRLASGMQRVTGGEIFCIDTESNRALHYADHFKFRHIAFGAPFSPLDYLAAIEHAKKRGARIVIVDSASHEHEGPGGVLEWHETEVQRLSGGDRAKADRVNMLAWSAPKAARRRLINTVTQLGVSAIFCFRAKEKIKPVKGGQPIELGFMPIGGEEWVFEMTMNCLLYPGSKGFPTWNTEQAGERTIIKLPAQFRGLFAPNNHQLDETIGQSMAEWAKGGAAPTRTFEETDALGDESAPQGDPDGEPPATDDAASQADGEPTGKASEEPCWEPVGGGKCKRERGHTGPHIRG